MKLLLSIAMSMFFVGCGGADMPPATPSSDGGTMSSTVTPGSISFLEPCGANEECETGLCYRYNMVSYGQRCSKTCTMPSDCPAPSPGCSGMGVCKYR